MQTNDFQITGMDCAHCAHTLEQGVGKLNGITTCSVNLTSARLHVSYDPQHTDETAIIERIRALGYDIAPQNETSDQATPAHTSTARGPFATLRAFTAFLLMRLAITVPLLVGMALLLVAVLLSWFGLPGYVTRSMEVLALAIAGYPIARPALIALFIGRQMTIKLLMSIAAVGAVIIGETTEAATLMILYVIGEMLEGYTMQRSQHALQGLMALAPAEATLLVHCIDCAEHIGRDGYTGGPCPWCTPHEERRPVSQVEVGQVMLVKPGERMPLDGRIVHGVSNINQQHITGESMPVERSAGETVYAGSINGDGALEIEVTAPASATLLSRIASLVEQAQAQRAPIERFMDRFASVYTPVVVVIAVLVAVVPPLLFGQPFWNTATVEHGWLYRALALLVIACPCALVISTPVSIVSALSAATRNGILIKGGAVLEALRHIRVFAFDKTGTLTSGKPRVTTVQCIDTGHIAEPVCRGCDTVLALAAAVESRTSHPLALAVVQAAAERQLANRYTSVANVLALPGRGVQGTIDGETIVVGSHAYFDAEYGHRPVLCEQIKAAEAGGQTALLVGNGESGIMGYLTVADEPRPVSRQVLANLKSAGIEHTAILTGDNAGAAERVAQAVGATDVLAGLLPADKLTAIHDLRARYGPVAMVGDGVNDTPALATADIGIAMGAAGSAQALETADIALMNDDLTRLPFLLRLSRRTAAIMRQNIALSLLPKFTVMIVALMGIAPLWLAVVADMGTSLLVTANGMRLMGERG